jgi:FlaA1/EpsC-like NDP-sugar epimerase
MVQFARSRKRLVLMVGDICAVLAANGLALALRFDFDRTVILAQGHLNLAFVALDLVLTPFVFGLTGLYQGYWRYAGLDDLYKLIKAVSFKSVALIVAFYALNLTGLSRGVVVISAGLLLFLAGLLRLIPRFRLEFLSSRQLSAGRRTLIVGAGDTGESLLRELRKNPQLQINPVGLIDDDRDKLGASIHGVPVLGTRASMVQLIDRHGVTDLILAIPSASSGEVREMFDLCRSKGVSFRTVPTLGEIRRGVARVSSIRPVDLEDLLGREVVDLDVQALRKGLVNRRVLVTGAAGSIGRELARQIATYAPQDLILIDRNENNLFYLEAELRDLHPTMGIHFILGDIVDRARMEQLFRTFRPDIVFHAAAYKHVPLTEKNPVEAVKNNVLSTTQLSQIASASGVERFIYISTDKAVKPSGVMGATKKLGERIVKSLNGQTRFMAVRFGNVLGSDGSVVPTFRKQIAAGGPVTVTHPEATRYFMTIPEAVQLVLTAGVTGEGNETFLLQMGEPVRILDVARHMIELSGLEPGKDVKIVFTGLRPGEKLHEELRGSDEEVRPTANEKIMILGGIEPMRQADWETLKELGEASFRDDATHCVQLLGLLVKDYTPVSLPKTPQAAPPPKVVDMGFRRRLDVQV